MTKRGLARLELPPIFRAALGFGPVFLAIIYAAMQIANNEAYLQQLYLNRLGLNLQAIQGLGKDINAEIDIQDAGAYHLVFQGTEVSIIERGMPANRFIFTHVPENLFTGGEFKPAGTTIGPLKQYKRGTRYGVAKPADVPNEYLLTCDTPKGKPLTKIALDPGHGYDAATGQGEPGYQLAIQTIESKQTLKIANALKSGRTRFNPTRDKEEQVTIDQRQKTPGDAIISLHAGTSDGNIDTVKAYYNPTPESRRLACEILNSITTEFKIPVRLIPVNTDYLTAKDPKNVLKGTRPEVLLEIGNAKKTDSMLTQDKQLALEIYKGIENYGLA